jgi:hypothetical protein
MISSSTCLLIWTWSLLASNKMHSGKQLLQDKHSKHRPLVAARLAVAVTTLMRGQAAGNLARQKGDIQARGLQDAYTQAMAQFNTAQGQNQAAQQLNAQQQQFGAGLGLQGLQTAMTGAKVFGGYWSDTVRPERRPC